MATKPDVEKQVKFLEKKTSNGMQVFLLGNGERVTFDLNKCSKEIQARLMVHGAFQKIGDGTSGYGKDKDYAGAKAEMQGIVDALYAGQWERKGERAGVIMEDLASAIAQVQKAPLEKVLAAVEKATPEQRKEWAKNAKVALIMANLAVERMKKAAEGAEATGEGLPTFG